MLHTEPFLAPYRAASCSKRNGFLLLAELLLAPNETLRYCWGLHSGPDVIELSVNMTLPEAIGCVAEVLVADVLCTAVGPAKPMGS